MSTIVADPKNYYDLIKMVNDYYEGGLEGFKYLNEMSVSNPELFYEGISKLPNVEVLRNQAGKVLQVIYNDEAVASVVSNVGAVADSNLVPAVTSATSEIAIPGNVVVAESGEIVTSSGLATAGNFIVHKAIPVVLAASAGVTLGKWIDKGFYETGFDPWGLGDMEYYNPESWAEIMGKDTFGGWLCGTIFGVKDDGTSQQYMTEQQLAYMSGYLAQQGFFASQTITDDYSSINPPPGTTGIPAVTGTLTPYLGEVTFHTSNPSWGDLSYTQHIEGNTSTVYKFFYYDSGVIVVGVCSLEPYTEYWIENDNGTIRKPDYRSVRHETNWGGKNFYYTWNQSRFQETSYIVPYPVSRITEVDTGELYTGQPTLSYLILFGVLGLSGGLPGTTNQPDAKLPNTADWGTDTDAILASLKEQYPELWENSVTQDVLQDDGTTKKITYVPVGTPSIDPANPEQPFTEGQLQTDTKIDPNSATQGIIDSVTGGSIKFPDTPTNPPNTGDGNTPPVPIPTGAPSSLFAIYNPTMEQVNQFGAWLWDSDFFEQIKKLFSDPMNAIIGLHKVYGTPITSGSSTIKVGYLDSQVASRLVSEQYITISCGSVDLQEYFGNVFDYAPYTSLDIYLPFIGIHPLNVADTMRSTITVTYQIDVLTGACLAQVEVKRDNAGGVIYAFSGNCAVQYPLSSGSYMGIVSSVASIAAGAVGTVVSGGSLLPAAVGAVGAATRMSSNNTVSRSGSFGGNAGAMGIKKPYLIITRPQTAMADDYATFIGNGANQSVKISDCTGYIKCLDVHLENMSGATTGEIAEINQLLKSGVLVN